MYSDGHWRRIVDLFVDSQSGTPLAVKVYTQRMNGLVAAAPGASLKHPPGRSDLGGDSQMNKDQVLGKLDQLKGEMKRRCGQLTDDDITEARGDIQKLMGRIREKSGDQQ